MEINITTTRGSFIRIHDELDGPTMHRCSIRWAADMTEPKVIDGCSVSPDFVDFNDRPLAWFDTITETDPTDDFMDPFTLVFHDGSVMSFVAAAVFITHGCDDPRLAHTHRDLIENGPLTEGHPSTYCTIR